MSQQKLKADPENAPRMDDQGSLWANTFFPITDTNKDRRQWMRDWDRAVIDFCTDEPEEDHEGSPVVFGMSFWKMNIQKGKKLGQRDHQHIRSLQADCKERFEEVVSMLRREDEKAGKRHWSAWFGLIGWETRRDIMCDGFEETCRRSWFGQDARMLCPELNSYEMLWRRGEGLFDFIDECLELWDAGGMAKFDEVMVRNEWWGKAYADKRVVQETPEIRKWCYEFMTSVRHLFIRTYIYSTSYSKIVTTMWLSRLHYPYTRAFGQAMSESPARPP